MSDVRCLQSLYVDLGDLKISACNFTYSCFSRFRISVCFIILFLYYFLSTSALAAENVARLSHVEGNIDYRPRGSINWVDLGDVRALHAGDLLFLKKNASADIEYANNGTSVHLSDEMLFRVTQKAPIHSKKVHVFGIEKNNTSKTPSGKHSPFERGIAMNAKESAEGGDGKNEQSEKGEKSENRLQVNRNVSHIELAYPGDGSSFVVSQFPTKMLVKVANPKPESKYWVFVWGEGDTINPIWSSYSRGEFSDISIERPGVFEIQVFSDDETEVSDPRKVVYVKSDERFSGLGAKLSELKGDQTVILE